VRIRHGPATVNDHRYPLKNHCQFTDGKVQWAQDRKSGDLPESCFTHLLSRESSGTARSNILLET